MHISRREWTPSIEYLREAITQNSQDVKSMVALASIFISTGRLNDCKSMCQQVLIVDPDNDDAVLLLADLTYQKNESDEAMKHFAQILVSNTL